MMRDFAGKTAFVTGGASGIGLAMAQAFGTAGMKVMIADIEEGALSAAVASVKETGAEALGIVCDVSDRDSVQRRGFLAAAQRRGRNAVLTALYSFLDDAFRGVISNGQTLLRAPHEGTSSAMDIYGPALRAELFRTASLAIGIRPRALSPSDAAPPGGAHQPRRTDRADGG